MFDPTSGEIAAHLELTYAYSTPRLDGRLVLVSAYAGDDRLTNLAIIDEKTLGPVRYWTMAGEYIHLARISVMQFFVGAARPCGALFTTHRGFNPRRGVAKLSVIYP